MSIAPTATPMTTPRLRPADGVRRAFRGDFRDLLMAMLSLYVAGNPAWLNGMLKNL